MSFDECQGCVVQYLEQDLQGRYLNSFTPLQSMYEPSLQKIEGSRLKFVSRPRAPSGAFYKRRFFVQTTDRVVDKLFNSSYIQIIMRLRNSNGVDTIKEVDVTTRDAIRKNTDPDVYLVNNGFCVRVPDTERCSNPLYVSFWVQFPKSTLFSQTIRQGYPVKFICSVFLESDGTFTADECDVGTS